MAIYSLALVFVLVALSAAEDMPECAKAGFWKDVSSPACAILYDEEACGGNSTELLVSSAANGTARSATTRPGCSLYEGYNDLGRVYGLRRYGSGYNEIPHQKQYWTSKDNQSHEVRCRCFTNDSDVLSCKPSEEWILIAMHDNRKHAVASIFDFKYIRGYIVGPNGMVGTNGRHLDQKFLDLLRSHGLQTIRTWQEDSSDDKIVVPAKSCAFILQGTYKCGSFFYVWSNVQVRVQDSASTNGGTRPCNLDNASVVPNTRWTPA